MRRLIPMDGTVNFRDVGGYAAGPGRQTRWQRVYRSDSLAELTPQDLTRLGDLDLFGIADFRLESEIAAKPDRLPEGHRMRLLSPGFIPRGTEDMLQRVADGQLDAAGIRAEVRNHYHLFATEHLPNYTSTFRMMLEGQDRPVLLHCTSGKDRTGFGIALILTMAGCETETIIDDYLMTNDYRRDLRFMFSSPVDPVAVEMLATAHPEYLRNALQTLARVQGPPDSWLAAMGFDAAERTRLREIVTEPVSR